MNNYLFTIFCNFIGYWFSVVSFYRFIIIISLYIRKDIKANFANLDHCGDKICGSPEILKSYKFSNSSEDKSNLDTES